MRVKETISSKIPSSKRQVWRFLVRKAVYLVFIASIIFVLVLFHLTEREMWGYMLIIIGLSVSFLSSIILAIPSTPALKNKSSRNKFINELYYAFESFRNREPVEKGDRGFEEALEIIEMETDESFHDVEEIKPIGRHWGVDVEIDGETYDVGYTDIRKNKELMENDLEILCYKKGIKILSLGFLIQISGAIYVAMTV